MSSLAQCIKIHGLSSIEAKNLQDAAAAYRNEGFSAREANVGAVRDAIAELEAERNDILSQVERQINKPEEIKRDEFAKNAKIKRVKSYGVANGNRFAQFALPDGTTHDVKIRDGKDGEHETRVREQRKLLYDKLYGEKEPVRAKEVTVVKQEPSEVQTTPVEKEPTKEQPPAEVQPKQEVETATETEKPAEKEQKPGRAWVGNKWRTIIGAREIKKGKNKGRVEVTLPDGTKKKVDKADVKTWPEGDIKPRNTLISVLNNQKGEVTVDSEAFGELVNYTKTAIKNGYDKISDLRQHLKDTLGELYEKVKRLVTKAFQDAKRILKDERGAVGIDISDVPRTGKKAKKDSKTSNEYEQVKKENFGKATPTVKDRVDSAFDGLKSGETWERIKTQYIDKLNPIKLYAGEKAYKFHRMATGAQATFSMFMEHGKVVWDKSGIPTVNERNKGFLKFLDNLGKESEDFFYWLAAKRAEKLESEGRERLLTKGKRDVIFEGTRPSDDVVFNEMAKVFEEFNQSVLDYAVEAGLIDAEAAKSWANSFYLPFRRIFEDEVTREQFLNAPKKNSRFISSQIRKLVGSEKKLGDPLENILGNWMHLFNESIRNVARAEAYNFSKETNSGIVEEVKRVPKKELYFVKDETKKGKKRFLKKNEIQRILSFQKDGKAVYFLVNQPELFDALHGLDTKQFNNFLLRAMGASKRWLTYGATFGPAFRLKNAIRDTMQTALLDKSFSPFIDTVKGAVKAMREDQDYIKLMASGGGFGTSYFKADDPEVSTRYIRRIIKKEGKGAANRILDTPRKALDLWEKIGTVSENAARVGLYQKKFKSGESHLESAFAARDILDFTMSGQSNAVQLLIRVVPFLNARMQGLYKLGRAAKDVENRRNFIVRGLTLSAAALALWGWFKDDERYKELEDWDKWSYTHFWLGDLHYRIPNPFEVGSIFMAFPVTVADALYGNEETKHISEFWWHTLTQTFAISPPQLFNPIIEQWANKSMFTGRPIVGEYLQGLEPEAQADPWTSETMQQIGKTVGVSPKRLEALANGYFATLAEFILFGADTITANLFKYPKSPPWKIDDYPLVGALVREGKNPRYTKHQQDFYDLYTDADRIIKTVHAYQQTGNFEKAKELLEKNPKKIAWYKTLNRARLRASKINKQMRAILASTDLSPEEKEKRLNQLIKAKNALFQQIMEATKK